MRITLFITLSILVLGIQNTDAQNNKPCNCCSEEHTTFDFWLGDWEVTNPNGSKAGINKISKIQDGCIIKEEWTSATAGYTGTSYNFYNAAINKWEQVWIDNQGSILKLSGNYVEDKMVLESDESKNKAGKLVKNRITWSKNGDGTVLQVWDVVHEGKVISTLFRGLYKPIVKAID
ncbi:hypothetical protein ABN763_00745 [Spongiivirga sp. MCCC 1A20706]|uniref:hypothetical protein n=1 Tax=Spongiivirga sp. MCCC 1A20706 TaxID=3160963 RepID=UPI003977BADB